MSFTHTKLKYVLIIKFGLIKKTSHGLNLGKGLGFLSEFLDTFAQMKVEN